MKKSILIFTSSILMTCGIITSCSTPAQKVENAKEEIKEANKNLDEANKEYLTDVEEYKKDMVKRIADNNEKIAKLKSDADKENKENKESHQKRVVLLEKKNKDMKSKLDEYRPDGKEKWSIFKSDFQRDIDELTASLKDSTGKKQK